MTPRERLAWLAVLREPQQALAWSLPQWERVVRLARQLRLLARLARALAAAGLLEQLPTPVRPHLHAAMARSDARMRGLMWLIECAGQALPATLAQRVLLKGAAYVAQGLPIATGRLPVDLDMMVPKASLPAVQAALVAGGWRETPMDVMDQRYYRDWAHEVPPMDHPHHGLELDLHHNILPPVGRHRLEAARLFERALPAPLHGWWVLHTHDQILHCAAHLFFDSEAKGRLRDLVDLDGLLRHFIQTDTDWQDLAARAQTLGLAEPLALACHFCSAWLATPIPREAQARIAAQGRTRWGHALRRFMWAQALMPVEPDAPAPLLQRLAGTFLLAHYHRDRLPLRLLLPHLWRKWRLRRKAVREMRRGLKAELEEAMALGDDPVRLREQRAQQKARKAAAAPAQEPNVP